MAAPNIHAADAATAWREPQDGQLAATRSDEYAWRLFVALNWPADPQARAADRHAPLGAARPVVWESWQNANDVYLDGCADPGPWRRGRSGGAVTNHRFEALTPDDVPNLRHIVNGVMVPVREPLLNPERLTELRLNRSAYDYIRGKGLYCLDTQIRFYAQQRTVAFPLGAKQIKARWRPITEHDRSRYYTIEVRQADGTSRLYGLTALHLATKDLPSWFWASFEHVDNASAKDREGWVLPSRDAFACGSITTACDKAPTGMGLEGTVWANYRLRGTQTGYVDSQGQPILLGNSEFEAGMQPSSSCMTCHARSAIRQSAQQAIRLPVLASGNDGENAMRRGYVGLPDMQWYRGDAAGSVASAPFLPLDFVWSLSKAKSRHAARESEP